MRNLQVRFIVRQTRYAATIARLHGHDKRTLRMTYEAVTSESPRLILLLPYNERTREKSRDPPVISDRERRSGNIIGARL